MSEPFQSWRVTPLTVTAELAELMPVPLSGRSYLEVQNRGPYALVIGHDGNLSTDSGRVIDSGKSQLLPLGEYVPVYAVSSGKTDVRVTEFAPLAPPINPLLGLIATFNFSTPATSGYLALL